MEGAMGTRDGAAGAALGLLAGLALLGSAPAPAESDFARFQRLNAEASAAMKSHDYATAETRLGEMERIYPCQPQVLAAEAQAELKRGDQAAASATLARYAGYGLTLSPELAQKLAPALGDAKLRATLQRNAAVVGAPEPVFRTPSEPILVEKIIFAPNGDTILGAIHRAGLYRVAGGKLEAFSEPGAVAGVVGLEADPKRGDLWVASSALPQVANPTHAGSALVRLDLATGKRKAIYPLPRGGQQSWGDLTVGPDGTVYAGDALLGDIWRLKPGAQKLELFLEAGRLSSPQGMAMTPDGRRLLVADYTTGMHVIDIATGADHLLPGPRDLCLVGTDGLARDGDELYAVQNGISPQRIVAVRMNRAWTAVTSWRVLAANNAMLSEPTSAAVRGHDLYFVARSQWSDFSDAGPVKTGKVDAAVIARLRNVR
jgi:hypothetical protein